MSNDLDTMPLLPHEKRTQGVTPYFKHLSALNVAQSEDAGKEVWNDPIEVVELRLAGDRNYAPVFPVTAMHRRKGNREITFAEFFSEQYRQFLNGDQQTAGGTALEKLTDYGITPAQLSICRALKIYSIEALEALEGANLKNLGMSANALKEMAGRWRADQGRTSREDVDALRSQIAELQARIPAEIPSPEDIDALVQVADDEFESMEDAALKEFIAGKVGSKPRGNPSRETLLTMAREAAA